MLIPHSWQWTISRYNIDWNRGRNGSPRTSQSLLLHTFLAALFPGLPRWGATRKVKPIWILLKEETVSGSGISWAIYYRDDDILYTANIRLHSFMSLNVYFELLFAAKFLLTNVTRKPSTFIVWLQQMCLELPMPCETVWTVSTWVRLWISVNTNMLLQLTVNLKQLPTVTTIMRSTVAVYTTFMSMQAAVVTETLVTQWTLVRFFSRVDAHVSA